MIMRPGWASSAVVFALLSTITAAAASACVKIAAEEIPIGQIVFFRGFFALPVLLIFARLDGPLRTSLVVKSPLCHVQRAFIGCAGLTCFYLSISLLPLSLAVAVSYLVPTFVTLVEVWRAKWSSGLSLIVAAIVGLGGVLLFLGQSIVIETFDSRLLAGFACGVIGAALTSSALIRVRALTKTDTPGAIAFYFSVACATTGLLTASLGWSPFDARVAVALAGCGIFSAVSHMTLTMALARASPAKVAPFDYLILVWTFGYEVFVFHRSLTVFEVMGIVGVIASLQVTRVVRFARSKSLKHPAS